MHPCPACGGTSRQLERDGWWTCTTLVHVANEQVLIGVVQRIPGRPWHGQQPVFDHRPVYRECGEVYIAHSPLVTVL